ncbi:taste receptor type 2 member 19-like [Orycteropus afer afer]|uniref:Taste receptor type 2 n=1 Tax=Orycteropus afer afer TaxID=1230840 RepID=A0A8B7B0A0_ORYAF|nr:taste receptor type 2 member 19-like [Orycteropus afer afer]
MISLSLLQGIVATLLLVELILGHVANGFIALVYCIDWIKRQKISSADIILTALAVSRIGLLWVILISWYAMTFNSFMCRLKVVIVIAWVVTNHFSMWLATCLSIFYLLKIANFSNLIFLHLKWKVERLILVIMFGTLVILGFQLAIVIRGENMWKDDYEGNLTLKTKLCDIEHLSYLVGFNLAVFLPFTTSLTSLLLLIFSLGKHLKKMQLNGKGLQDPSTKAHVKAMQTVISFLLLFATYVLCLIISSWSSKMQQSKQITMFCQAIGIIYPSNHSFILILVNQKLRQASLSVLWWMRCWLKERKSSTP